MSSVVEKRVAEGWELLQTMEAYAKTKKYNLILYCVYINVYEIK